MAEAITIARPYAEAVFKLAREKNTLSSWSETLRLIKAVASDEQIKALIGNPQVPSGTLREIIHGACGAKLSKEGKQLIELLVDNDRLGVISQICDLFEKLKANHESTLEAKINSAFSLEVSQLEYLISILEKKFQRKINAQVDVDTELIGGVKIEIGDQVIDCSVYGRLEAMAAALKS
jgi:F-type H+-transporting ATPase subunit delta